MSFDDRLEECNLTKDEVTNLLDNYSRIVVDYAMTLREEDAIGICNVESSIKYFESLTGIKLTPTFRFRV